MGKELYQSPESGLQHADFIVLYLHEINRLIAFDFRPSDESQEKIVVFEAADILKTEMPKIQKDLEDFGYLDDSMMDQILYKTLMKVDNKRPELTRYEFELDNMLIDSWKDFTKSHCYMILREKAFQCGILPRFEEVSQSIREYEERVYKHFLRLLVKGQLSQWVNYQYDPKSILNSTPHLTKPKFS